MDIPWTFGPTSIAAFIAFVGVLIFVHELGHFLAAKFFDIKVLKFSLGFGPPLLAFRRGETVYQVAAVPLGGFVKMVGDGAGEEVAPEDRTRAFTSAPIYQRVIIALAGPVFNLVFPVLCFFAYNATSPTVLAPIVGQLEVGQPADRAGLRPGDRIVEVDGHRTLSFARVTELISARPGKTVPLKVLRDGETLTLEVTPEVRRQEDVFGGAEERGMIWLKSARAGTGVGVAWPGRNAGGFMTGDRVLRFGDTPVTYLEDLERAIVGSAGKTIDVVVARPEPLEAGDILHASAELPITLSVPIPAGASGLAELGLAPSEAFIREVVPSGAAARAGLAPGDQVLAVNGRPVRLFLSWIEALAQAKRRPDGSVEPVAVTVRRDGREQTISLTQGVVRCEHDVTKKQQEINDPGIGVGPIGAQPSCSALLSRAHTLSHWASMAPIVTEPAEFGVGEAFITSVRQTGQMIGLVATGIFKLFSRELPLDNVGGPLQLFSIAAQAAEFGLLTYLRTLALISINLGLINLLPVPIFDGGHLLLCAIEAVKRRPLSVRARELASLIGLVILFALLVLALSNDIKSLGIL